MLHRTNQFLLNVMYWLADVIKRDNQIDPSRFTCPFSVGSKIPCAGYFCNLLKKRFIIFSLQRTRFIPSVMKFRKITFISLMLVSAIFVQALSVVDHIHLNVMDEQECLICGSATGDAALVLIITPAIVPMARNLADPRVYQRYFSIVLHQRSRGPPLFLDV